MSLSASSMLRCSRYAFRSTFHTTPISSNAWGLTHPFGCHSFTVLRASITNFSSSFKTLLSKSIFIRLRLSALYQSSLRSSGTGHELRADQQLFKASSNRRRSHELERQRVVHGGRFWTKFEHCSPKTLTRNSDSRGRQPGRGAPLVRAAGI